MKLTKTLQYIGLGLAFALPSASSIAYAVPNSESYTIYFYDAAKTNYAGERVFSCGGAYYAHGVTTQHRMVIYKQECANLSSPNALCSAWDQFHGAFPNSAIHKEPCPFFE